MYCPTCKVDVASADNQPCFYCGTMLYAPLAPLPHDVRVFIDNETHTYYAGRSVAEIAQLLELTDSGRISQLELWEMDENHFLGGCDEAGNEEWQTFRETLNELVENGAAWPRVFQRDEA